MIRLLPLYYSLFFAVAFVWPSWRVWHRDRINPLILPRDDSAQGVIGVWFKIMMGGVLGVVLAAAWISDPGRLGALTWFEHDGLKATGTALLGVTILWIMVAQAHMGASWRLGIDPMSKTSLVDKGIFGISRNPIFLGLRLNMIGLFSILPNTFSLAIMLGTEILIAVQVRLEEAHLSGHLGQSYLDYCTKVRRWF